MNREVIANIIRFVLLVFVQGLILSNVDLWSGQTQIYLYILFVVMLPLRLSGILTMLLAFVMGVCVDMFYDSAGLHASAAVFVAFVRPYFITLYTPRDDYDVNDRPSISRLGLGWFFKFSGTLILIHSLWVFFIEAFGFSNFSRTLVKALSTGFVTLSVGLVVVYLFSQKRKER